MPNAATTLLLYCRAGFEGDLAAELMDRAAALEVPGYCRATNATGYVVFEAVQAALADRLWRQLPWRQLVFARQLVRGLAELDALPVNDRAQPIAATVAAAIDAVSGLYMEYPDTNEGKALSRFCRRFERPLIAALQSEGVHVEGNGEAPRLHALFLDSAHVLLGLSDPANSAPWPLGIPRLKRSREAPSRSTLKLDEALQTLLDADARGQLLRSGMTAVDLGAAPGGWSWQLARRGLHVTAVDNGPMDTAVLAGGLVEHVRADGFRYRPPKPVDWLVCDIVEQPHRVARLVADWLARGDCGAAIFNLKLPMKKRYAAVRDALAELRSPLPGGLEIACKQLYHDREEVTVYVRPET